MKKESRRFYYFISTSCLIALIFILTGTTWAQDTGTISGIVKDDSGDPLPGVSVTVKSGTTTKTAYTDTNGAFSVAGLAPGAYDVAAELSGFVKVEQSGVNVQAGTNSLDLTMKPGGLAELMVVTASKVETPLINAPATMTAISTPQIQASPAQNYADLLRTVPGLNVTQTSNRDINLTSRQANSTLATSQLALLDGRSIYLDFFGFIAWDFLPVNFNEIKQIEVIRGPASAVWGANAQTGVVNIITKSPRESTGTTVTFDAGTFNRDVDPTVPIPGQVNQDLGNGAIYGANIRFANAPNETWSYKLSGGYFFQDPLARPEGLIPATTVPDTNTPTGGVPYSLANYKNTSSSQPKFDVRVDQELGPDSRINYSGGLAATDGIIHTGIGPFDIQNGTKLGYGRVGYTHGNMKLNFFANILDGDAINQFGATAVNGRPVDLIFKNQTYDFEFGDSHLLGGKHILSYGGNYRRNNFDISIAPNGDNRNEFGGYVQDEFFVSQFRLVVGGRVDKFSVINDPVFSPRITAMYKPTPDNSFRFSFNRAFRSPSQINNFLDTAIVNAANLGPLIPTFQQPGCLSPTGIPGFYCFPSAAYGSDVLVAQGLFDKDLKQESTTAYEVGYTGQIGEKTTVSVSYYINDTNNNINFTPFLFYNSQNPPPGWPLPPQYLDFPPLNVLPAVFTYLNLGPLRSQGIELSWDQIINSRMSVYANYSYQKDPEILDADPDQIPYPPQEIIFPPNNRFNAGFNYDDRRFLGSLSINYTGDAFWTDVLDSRFWGPTDAFEMVNVSFGVHWLDNRMTTTLKITNLLNQQIQQHVFGDILKRTFVGEVRFDF